MHMYVITHVMCVTGRIHVREGVYMHFVCATGRMCMFAMPSVMGQE